MINKPFDTLPAITRLMELRKAGSSIDELANIYDCKPGLIISTLQYYDYRIKEIKDLDKVDTKGRYDDINFEVTNPGSSYKTYLKRANLKVYKGTLTFKKPSFQKPKNIE